MKESTRGLLDKVAQAIDAVDEPAPDHTPLYTDLFHHRNPRVAQVFCAALTGICAKLDFDWEFRRDQGTFRDADTVQREIAFAVSFADGVMREIDRRELAAEKKGGK